MIIKIDGMEELNKILADIPEVAKKAAHNELKIVAEDLKGKSQRLAPVDLGDLKGSAGVEVNGLEATIFYTEPYATRQHEELEYNHPKGGQAKYLEQPFKESVNDYTNAIGDAIKKAIT